MNTSVLYSDSNFFEYYLIYKDHLYYIRDLNQKYNTIGYNNCTDILIYFNASGYNCKQHKIFWKYLNLHSHYKTGLI